jgi:hypothetical protein
VSVDAQLPILSSFSNERYGHLQVLLAMGSLEQVRIFHHSIKQLLKLYFQIAGSQQSKKEGTIHLSEKPLHANER